MAGNREKLLVEACRVPFFNDEGNWDERGGFQVPFGE